MTNILEKILDQKRLEIAALDAQALRHAAEQSPTPRDFLAAIQRRRFGTQPSLIAELKRASPSKGILAPHLDLFQVADIYTQNGAAAISVLTDEKFFQGKLETLRTLLTRKEYSVFVMLWRQQMKIKDIAAALGVNPRTINNYERSIKDKINKEFNI